MSTQALEKELKKVRRKAAILQELIDLRCNLRDCPISMDPLIGWRSPKGYDKAAVINFSEGGFVVYGPSEYAVKEAAAFYIQQKHDRSLQIAKEYAEKAVFVSVDWLEKWVIGPGKLEGEIIGFSPDGFVVEDVAEGVHYWQESEVTVC